MKNYTFSGLTRYWWVPLITGLICIGLGIWTLCSPVESIKILAYAFAVCFAAAGIFYIVFSCMASRFTSDWGWGLAMGILEVIGGVWLLMLPAPQLEVAFIYIVGFWILFAAISSVSVAFAMPGGGAWTVWAVLLLIATIIFGVIFLTNPLAGGVAVWIWLALSLIVFGVYRLVFAGRLKTLREDTYGML